MQFVARCQSCGAKVETEDQALLDTAMRALEDNCECPQTDGPHRMEQRCP